MKGSNGMGLLVLVIVGFLVSALVPINENGTVLQNLGMASTVPGGTGGTSADPSDCPETTPSWDPNSYNVEDASALTEGTNIYRTVGSKAWQTFTQGTALTLPVGSTVEYVFGITTSDTLDNAYGPYGTFTVGCQEDLTGWNTLESPAADDMGLYADEVEGSLTNTFYNEDSNAAAQTFTAGSTHKVYFKWTAGNEEYFGNPYIKTTSKTNLNGQNKMYPNVLCMDLNTTTFDAPVYVKIKGGDTLPRVSTPIRHGGATGKTSYCYAAPIIDDSDTWIEVSLNADDSTAPAVDDTAYLYGANFFVEPNDPSFPIHWGVEDSDGTAVGQDTYDSLTIDVT